MPDSTLALRNAENNAISNSEPSYGNSGGNSGFYTGSGRSQSKKKTGWMKKRTAAVVITLTLLLGGGAAFLGSSNSLLAPALEALTTSSTQTSYTSYTERSKYLVKGMMIDDVADDIIVSHPWTSKYLKVPNYMKTRFSDFGIDISGSGKDTRMIWKDQTMDADGFIKMYNENVEFRNDFTKAKRGRVATFFDDVAEKIYTKLGISRNLFSKYKQTGDADADIAAYKDTMSSKFDGNSSDLNTHGQKPEQTYKDEDGKTHTDPAQDEISHGSATTNQTADAHNKATSMLSSLADKVGELGSWACTAMKVGSMIGAVVAAQETYQSINYFMGLMENISKMKAGYGDASAVNEVLNFFSTSQPTNTTSDFGKLKITNLAQGADPEIEPVTENGSPLEASGVQLMLANAPTTSDSTRNYSLERIITALGGAATFGATAMSVCAGADAANSLLSIGTAIATGGASIVSNFVFKSLINITVATGISAFFSFLVPTLAQTFFSNAFETAVGVPAGHLFAKGAAAANMREGRSGSGQSPSSEAQVAEFNHSTQQVLALDSEVDRLNHSPFDTTNPNTFFGSIAYSLLPTITSSNITSTSALIRSTASSLSSLLRGNNVYADGNGTSYLTTFNDNCPMLQSIGAAGDLYCNPIVTTDMSTINLSPSDDKYVEVISKDLDCSGTSTSSNSSTSSSSIDGSNVTIIGDSITYGARNKLENKLSGVEIYSEVGKSFSRDSSKNPSGLSIIKGSDFSPRKNVVFALGTNDQNSVTERQIEEVINTIGANHNIYFITNYGTTYSGSSDYSQNNQRFKDAANKHTNVFVIPWAENVSTSGNATNYVPAGDVHPTSAGQDLFVDLIYRAIAEHNGGSSDSGDDSASLGNCRVKEKTDLARYITYCDGRDSPFGIVDQNILGAEETGNMILNSLPGINDFMGLINAGLNLASLNWATGKNCVNTGANLTAANTNDYQDNSFWESKGKYYQRYIEDQRILEQMGAYEGSKNPVTAYTEEYEKQYEATHPEANTYIGYLSRISGLTVENTETVLAFITYYHFVDQYDPTLRIAMDGDTTEPQSGEQVVASIQDSLLRFDDSNIDTPLYADTSKYIAYVDYSDLRNRSYAA